MTDMVMIFCLSLVKKKQRIALKVFRSKNIHVASVDKLPLLEFLMLPYKHCAFR